MKFPLISAASNLKVNERRKRKLVTYAAYTLKPSKSKDNAKCVNFVKICSHSVLSLINEIASDFSTRHDKVSPTLSHQLKHHSWTEIPVIKAINCQCKPRSDQQLDSSWFKAVCFLTVGIFFF